MRFSVRSTHALLTGVSMLAFGLAAAPAEAQQTGVEEIVVTAEKRAASIQDVPIAVSAFSQDTLETLQISGGPNLQQAIPNVNFAKANFTGSFNFQIRGIGAQLVGGSGDVGVGVHLNGVPLTSNNLFNAEFYDLERLEVLRGPQGTLYGRNATGGVVNVITAKPEFGEFGANGSVTYGNYNTIRADGAVNIPLGEELALRVAGQRLTRDGYADNLTTGNDIDGRDLWSIRATLGAEMGPDVRAWLMYEHFQEDSDRLRSGKQYCVTDPGKTSVGGVPVVVPQVNWFLSQGCVAGDLTSSRGVTNSNGGLAGLYANVTGLGSGNFFAGSQIPTDRRTIQAVADPVYKGDTDFYALNFEWDLTPSLTLTSLTSFTDYSVFTSEDYIKSTPTAAFNTAPPPGSAVPAAVFGALFPGGFVSDPQLGRANRAIAYDISRSSSQQETTELRLQSDFDGPLNFNVGGIYMNYTSLTDYYVFFNTGYAFSLLNNVPVDTSNPTGATLISRVNDSGRQYFLNRTPYELTAKAAFGELYYQVTDSIRATLGVRYTDDEKAQKVYYPLLTQSATAVPTALTAPTNAYLIEANPRLNPTVVQFKETTGRANIDWQPNANTLFYASYSRGYKAGGANPPPSFGVPSIKPTFDPEFVNAFEVGTKNQLMDGRLVLNVTGFHYDYEGYQISKIVNRTALNENIDAKIYGLELEAIWRPIEPLLFTGNVGYLNTEIQSGRSIDTIDRTNGNAAFTVIKNSQAGNCIVPTAALGNLLAVVQGLPGAPVVPGVTGNPLALLGACSGALTALGVTPSEGFEVNLAGKELPLSPKLTASVAAEWTHTINDDWQAVFHVDYYWQDESWARIYNKPVYDLIPARDNINLSVELANVNTDLSIKAFVRNAADADDVTAFYLTDDSSGLFTNAFLVEPRTYGVTVSKRF